MKISNKTLGIIAMICAPGFLLQTVADSIPQLKGSPLGGICDIIYMCGWMCSVVAMRRIHTSRLLNKGVVFNIQLAFLTLANIWNVWVTVDATNNTILFHVLDMFWPLSNLCFLFTGIYIAVKSVLINWHRYIVLIAGLWLPIMIVWMNISGKTNLLLYSSATYTLIVWALIGFMIYKVSRENGIMCEPVYPLMFKI